MGLNETDIRRVAWTAAQAFLGAFFVLAPGIWKAPNMAEAKAAAIAAVVAGLAAAFSTMKNLLLPDTSTLK